MLGPRGARSVCRIAVTGRLRDQTYYKKSVSRGFSRTISGTFSRTFCRANSRKFAAALGKREKLTNITQWVILGGQMGGRLLCIKSLYNILIYY